MDYETSTQLGAGFFLVFGVWSLVGLAVYVWYLWSLSRLFPYLGLPSGWGWIPLWNQWQLIQRGGLPGWLAIFFLVPGLSIVALVVSIIAIHRINTEFGKGGGFTVLGAFIPPLWATLFASQLRDREYGAPGYASGGYPQAPGAAGPEANGFPAAPGSSGGFAPQPGAHDQHDPAWQGLPPVPQQAAAHDPWAVPQQAPQQQVSQPAAQSAPPQAAQGQYASGAAPAAQPAAPADPWQQQAAAPAPAPAPNNWGFSNTTEGDFERLAAEGAPPRQPAPLGAVAPPRPFSWPAVEDTNVEHESGPLLLPEPSAAALSQGQGVGAADAAAAGPATPAAEPEPAPAPAPAAEPAPTAAPAPAAEPAPAVDPAAAEPSIFDRVAPAAPPAAAPPVAAPPVAAPPAAVPAPPAPPAPEPLAPQPPASAPAAPEPIAPEPIAPEPIAPSVVAPPAALGGLDEDHTVVVSRRTRWGIELPGGETLELEGDDIVIGRKPEPRDGSTVLQISDPTRTTSKSHARLRRDGDSWTIEDLQSTNGVSLVGPDGAATQLEPGRTAEATEQMIIGTLEVRLREL